jgi:UDP-MurNAc hydroxylase
MTSPAQIGLRVGLVGHASIILETSQSKVLCDPWFFGTAFNDGWMLRPEIDMSKIDMSNLTHIWLSHEHPDHFHIPTLKKIATLLDPKSIEILFQDTNSEKIFDALAKMGFTKFRKMPHLEPIVVDSHMSLFVYAHRHLDSALGVLIDGKPVVLNINDTELTSSDIKIIKNKFGQFNIVFNQFSIAGFEGHYDAPELQRQRLSVLEKVVEHHRLIGASVTVPFASFMCFCKPDNERLNAFVNNIADAKSYLDSHGCGCAVLRINSELIAVEDLANQNDIQVYETYYQTKPLVIQPANEVPIEACQAAFSERTALWKSKTLRAVYNRLAPVTVWIEDLALSARMNFENCQLELISLQAGDCDLVINSQPLHQAFAMPFGIQTLGVSGRYHFNRKIAAWKLVRIISSLSNAGIYFGVQSMLSPATLKWVWARRKGLSSQIAQQVSRFSR